MIKTILIKLLIRLTANFLLRYLVKKYMSRIAWPHMNILLTYRNKHVHIHHLHFFLTICLDIERL